MREIVAPESVVADVQPQVAWRRLEWFALGALLCVAFGLRLWAVRWGLPYVDHPDEPALVNVVLKMMRSGDWNPHFFLYPSLYFYLLRGVFTVHFQWGLATGLYTGLDQMPITTDVYTNIPGFFAWGRMPAIVAGSLTTPGVWLLARRSWGRGAAFLAALFIATLPYHMRHSQYVTTDVFSAWLVLLAYLGATAIAQTGGWRAYLLAGLCAGLAASTKYNAAIIVLPLIVAHGLYWRRRSFVRIARLIGCGAVTLLAFLAGTPYAVLSWSEFWQGVVGQVINYGGGAHGDYLGAWNVAGYLDFFWNEGLWPLGSIALVVGLVILLRRRAPLGVLWLSFAVPYLVLHLAQSGHFMRNLLPLIVLSALPIGIAGATAAHWGTRRAPRYRLAALGFAGLALFGLPAKTALEYSVFQAQPNTKALADAFIRTLPRGQRIAVELPPVVFAGDPLIEPVPFVTAHTLEWYRANNYRYLVSNDQWRDNRDRPLYQALAAGSELIQVFEGDAGGEPGPRIEVLDLGQRPDDLATVRKDALFGPDLRLLGYELRPGGLRPAITPLEGADTRVLATGDSLQLNLTWQALRSLPYDYALFIHVLDAGGQKVAQRDALLRQDDYQSSRWQPGEVVVDRADVPLPALPPGTYTIALGVYRMDTGERLPLARPEPGTDSSILRLTTIQVR